MTAQQIRHAVIEERKTYTNGIFLFLTTRRNASQKQYYFTLVEEKALPWQHASH